MPHQAIPDEAEARISKALPHLRDMQTDTKSVSGTLSPDGTLCVAFFDFWEFHMGATMARIALATPGGRIVKVFPSSSTSTSHFLSTWSEDSSVAAICLGNAIVLWSVPKKRFALACFHFRPLDLELADNRLTVRESVYRWNKKKDFGEYVNNGKGAVFALAKLEWQKEEALDDLEKAGQKSTTKKASKLKK